MNAPQQVSFLRAPIYVWWDITLVCNLKCRQCYSGSGKRAPNELTLEEVKGIIDQLVAMKVFFIYFLGGEPFLRRDFLDILAYCQKVGIDAVVNSNGWKIDATLARRLRRLDVKHVRISIDGATAETHDAIRGVEGSFDRATAAIRHLHEAGIPRVGMVPTLMKPNYHEAPAMVDLAISHGADELQFVQICATGRGQNDDALDFLQIREVSQLLRAKKSERGGSIELAATDGVLRRDGDPSTDPHAMRITGCGVGRTCVNISPEGKVLPCLLDREPLGDLRRETFETIWQGPALTARRAIKPGCASCGDRMTCSGSCPL